MRTKQAEWNTGRLYTEAGQPMRARLLDDGRLIFADYSRMIWGALTVGKPVYEGSGVSNLRLFDRPFADARALSELVMQAYDAGHYAQHDDEGRALYLLPAPTVARGQLPRICEEA